MSDVAPGVVQIFLKELPESFALRSVQVRYRDPLVILHTGGSSIPGDDVARCLVLEDYGSELPSVQQGQEFTSEAFLRAEQLLSSVRAFPYDVGIGA